MEALIDVVREMTRGSRIALIVVLAGAAHLLVMLIRRGGAWILGSEGGRPGRLARQRPKLASLITLVVSTATFAIYFGAVGLIFNEFGVSLATYFASATVLGLAVGFGLQGLVQDIVIGLTLIFSDVIDVGEVADVGGQTGRVQAIGLRFTVLRTLLDQQVFVPNRNVLQINRYRNGYVRVYADAQVPEGLPGDEVRHEIEEIARGMHSQHPDIILDEPESLGIRSVGGDRWSYLRVKFKIWPGQGVLIEQTFRQRVLAGIRKRGVDYPDWMVVVTYRARG